MLHHCRRLPRVAVFSLVVLQVGDAARAPAADGSGETGDAIRHALLIFWSLCVVVASCCDVARLCSGTVKIPITFDLATMEVCDTYEGENFGIRCGQARAFARQ